MDWQHSKLPSSSTRPCEPQEQFPFELPAPPGEQPSSASSDGRYLRNQRRAAAGSDADHVIFVTLSVVVRLLRAVYENE
jgi:hypothetical protein